LSRKVQPDLKPNVISRQWALFIIIMAAILSYMAANIGVDLDKLELGALFNMFGPPIMGVAALVLFFVIDWVFPQARLGITIAIAFLLVIAGFMIRAEG
jgi:hypothetical protein